MLTYQKANNIVLNYIDKDKQNIELLKLAIKNNLHTIQFCYSRLYPKIYARTNASGIQNKAKFHFVYNEWKKNKNALQFIQTPIVNELTFPQAPIKQEKNADNYKNRILHPTEQKPIEVIDLTNVNGEEQPETFEKRVPILPDENFVQEKREKLQKKTSAKIDTKSLNNARVAMRNEKKENLKRQAQQNAEKMNAIKKQKL